MYAFRSAVEIAGLGVPVLAFALVHRELYGVSVGAVKGGVFVEDTLDPVVAGGKVAKTGGGVTDGVISDDGGLAGGEGVDIGAENLLRLDFILEDLRAGFGVIFCGDHDVDAAVEGGGAEFRIERDGEVRLRRGIFCGRSLWSGVDNCGRSEERHEARQSVGRNSADGFARGRAKTL